jgi:hypothetical protein
MKYIKVIHGGLMSAAIFVASSSQAAVLLTESFETNGEGTRYTSATEFKDVAGTGYFMRSNNSQTSGQLIPNGLFAGSQDRRYGLNAGSGAGPYSGMDGTWAWVGEGVNGDGSGPYPLPASVTLNNVSTAGYTGLQISGLFGAVLADGYVNPSLGDYMRVSYSLDGGAFTTGLWFAPSAALTSQLIYLDTDNDGFGNVSAANLLDKPLKSFSFAIPDASSVQIRIEVSANAAGDEFAFDFLQLAGSPVIPEPTSAALLGVALVALGWRRARN